MDIKPKYDTHSLNIQTDVQRVSLNGPSKKVIKDPSGSIPNGIYNVISWENTMATIAFVISLFFFLGGILLTILYATVFNVGWFAYVIPTVTVLLSGYKLVDNLIRKKYIKTATNKYKEDLKIGVNHIPPFLSKLYREYHIRQTGHNWLTFFILLNGGIITLMLWWLKDVKWWIFDFDKWIHNTFSDPNLMVWIFSIGLIATAIFHIYMTIQRKRKIVAIDLYFGENVVPHKEISDEKARKNKTYRRLFILYVLIIFVIPIVVRIVLKFLGKK